MNLKLKWSLGLASVLVLGAAGLVFAKHYVQPPLTQSQIAVLQNLAGAARDQGAQAALATEAERGSEFAQLALGEVLLSHDVASDVHDGVTWLDRVADHAKEPAAKSKALSDLGKFYFRGAKSIEPDYSLARVRLQQAVDLGDGPAAYHLGLMAKNGLGVSKDSKLAASLFLQAANKNIPAAMFLLANMYLTGDGVPKDDKQVRVWLERAAEMDHPEAAQMVAMGLHDGSMGFEKDEKQASMQLAEAAHALKERAVDP